MASDLDVASSDGGKKKESANPSGKKSDDVRAQITLKQEPTTNNLIMKMMEFITKENHHFDLEFLYSRTILLVLTFVFNFWPEGKHQQSKCQTMY